MKKKVIIILTILLILIIAGAILIINQQKNAYDKNKEQDLGLSNYLNRLEECREVVGIDRANLSESLRMCPSLPEQEVFDKLGVIKDLKGVVECGWTSSNYKECEGIVEKCNNITSFIQFKSSVTSGGNSPTYTTIGIYDCGKKGYYLSKYSSPPPNIQISKIKLTEEQISALQ